MLAQNFSLTGHNVVSRDEWRSASDQLLEREKEHTKAYDELTRQRHELPWVAMEKSYTLQTEHGPKTLTELFDGRSQLTIYHFMFGPTFEVGCPVNSSIADSIDGLIPHLAARDLTMLCVSGAPIEKLLAFRDRMGWNLNWASSYESEFNREIGFADTLEQTRAWVDPIRDQMVPVAERNARHCGTDLISYLAEGFGFNTFVLDKGLVYQSYSTTGRGVEFLMGYYPILDRTPRGRDEDEGFQLWIQRHDEY
jgi:predicted dithiol-disulfide oxidoreductase (DUF899 family)